MVRFTVLEESFTRKNYSIKAPGRREIRILILKSSNRRLLSYIVSYKNKMTFSGRSPLKRKEADTKTVCLLVTA